MKLTIASKNIHVNKKLEAVIEKKFSKLDKYFSSDVESTVMCSEVKPGLCKIEATIHAAGIIFHAEESSNDIYFCIDRTVDKRASQMSRFKTKLVKRNKSSKSLTVSKKLGQIVLEDIPDYPVEEDGRELVKVKRFTLEPMSTDEAILQMEMLEHNFFVFRSEESHEVCVVYRRKDGSYGLLETE